MKSRLLLFALLTTIATTSTSRGDEVEILTSSSPFFPTKIFRGSYSFLHAFTLQTDSNAWEFAEIDLSFEVTEKEGQELSLAPWAFELSHLALFTADTNGNTLRFPMDIRKEGPPLNKGKATVALNGFRVGKYTTNGFAVYATTYGSKWRTGDRLSVTTTALRAHHVGSTNTDTFWFTPASPVRTEGVYQGTEATLSNVRITRRDSGQGPEDFLIFSVHALPGNFYRIEGSTDLQTWKFLWDFKILRPDGVYEEKFGVRTTSGEKLFLRVNGPDSVEKW